MNDENLTIIEETTPEENIVDEDIDTEELDVGEILFLNEGTGVQFNSMEFIPTDGQLLYSNNTAKFNGQFRYSTMDNPNNILTAKGAISFKIMGDNNIVVDAYEDNSTLEVHLDENIVKTLEDLNIDTNALKVDYQQLNDLVKSIPFAKSFANIESLIQELNMATADKYNVGTNLFVKTFNVPDFWVFSNETTSIPYTYTTDDNFINAIKENNGSIQVGYYKISFLETDKVDLSDYYTKTESDAITDELQRDILKVDGILAETNYETNKNAADIAALKTKDTQLIDDIEEIQMAVGDIQEYGLTTNTPQIIKKEGAKIFEGGFGISSQNGADVVKISNYGNALSFLGADGNSMFYLDKAKQSASAFGKELMTKDDFVAQHGTKVTVNGVFQETFNADTKADKIDIQNFVEKTKTVDADTATIANTGKTVSMGVQNQDSGSILGLSSNSLQLSISEDDKESSIQMLPNHVDIDTEDLTWNGETVATQEYVNQKTPTKLSELMNDTDFVSSTVNNLVNYYTKTDSYNKVEVNQLISNISSINIKVVTQLPTEDISTSTIYLVPKQTATEDNIYDEYIYVSGKWELIGSTSIDLTNYYTKTEIDNLLSPINSEISTINNDISDIDQDIININSKFNNYLPLAGGIVTGNIISNADITSQTATFGATRLIGNITSQEEDYVIVTDAQGNMHKRAMNKVLDDIGGSTILNDGIRQISFDVKPLQDSINNCIDKTSPQDISAVKNFIEGIKIDGINLENLDGDLIWNNRILSTRLDNLSGVDVIFDTTTSSTGTYNFKNSINNYAFICFAYYNNNGEYCYMVIPTSGFNLTTSSRTVFLNSSSAENSRYILVYHSSDTAFTISAVSKCTLRFVYGIPV